MYNTYNKKEAKSKMKGIKADIHNHNVKRELVKHAMRLKVCPSCGANAKGGRCSDCG